MFGQRENQVKETHNAVLTETDSDEGERRLNQYVLLRELGRGAFGIVVQALDSTTRNHVAIKEYSKKSMRRQRLQARGGFGMRGRGWGSRGASSGNTTAANTDAMDLVRGEIAIMKKLNHPYVVRLFEVLDETQGDSLFMVYELCSNGPIMNVDLEHDAEPLKEEDARKIFRQLVLGIEYLHENDIVHRDIKPDNILLHQDGTIRIVDFGVSEIFTPGNDRTTNSGGSPAFMAPELCTTGRTEFSAKSADIWAMGVTLYCLVNGHLPFRAGNVVDLYEKIKSTEPTYPNTMSSSLRNLLKHMLTKDHTHRATISDIRNSAWITNDGREPLLDRESNLTGVVTSVTEEDLKRAITSIGSLFTVIKAVTKLRRSHNSLSQT